MLDKVKELRSELIKSIDYELTRNDDEVEGDPFGSPIEKILNAALVTSSMESTHGDPLRNYDLSIYPQPTVEIGKKTYRPDFLLTMVQAVKISGYQYGRYFDCYIECDGHDFHERTKEQAKNDRQKDRLFMNEGLQLIRYTGSEIYNDPMKCAFEIENYMFRSLEGKELDLLH